MMSLKNVFHRCVFKLLLPILLVCLAICSQATAAPVTVVREYTYRAGDADSKLTCRSIALEQVKRLLLEELGTYLISNTEVKDSALTKDEIVTYTAGAVVTVVIEERWNGEDYFLKAKVTADGDDVAKAIGAMRNDREKTAELVQLRKQASDSLGEIERLRRELAQAKSSGKPGDRAEIMSVQNSYNLAVARLTAKDYLEQGIRLRKSGTIPEAVNEFSKAIESAPSWARPYVTRGAALILMDEPEKALSDIEMALKLKPSDMTAVSLHGVLLLKLGRGAEGVAEFKRVAAASPEDFSIHANMGGILIKNNMPREAIFFLTRAIDLYPDDRGRTYLLRAQAYSRLGEKQKAVFDLRMAARQGNLQALELLK